INHAARTYLILWLFRILASHPAPQLRRNLVRTKAANLLDIKLSPKEIVVDPPAALLEKLAIFVGRSIIPGGTSHLFRRAQSPQVVDSAQWVRPVVFHLVVLVLHSTQNAVAVSVPAPRTPSTIHPP